MDDIPQDAIFNIQALCSPFDHCELGVRTLDSLAQNIALFRPGWMPKESPESP
jgi:hypothetical protein